MIKVENLSYDFPQKDLYDHISFTIESKEHCAFIGSSGSGKSTLIDLILHPDDYLFEGKLDVSPSLTTGYVSQFSEIIASDLTVFDYLAEKFVALQDKLAAICVDLETATEIEPLLELYQETLDAFDAIGGDNYENLILKKLHLANLTEHAKLPLSALSGGEFKLIQVIREMLNEPMLLIMDEPDVFLDFENLNALKTLINSHKGTLLVITHNRFLLTHCFNKILHLENKQLQAFEGSYLDYHFSLLETKIDLQEQSIADTEEINRNDALIERLREEATYIDSPAKGKSLKARVKIQERLLSRRILAPFLAIKEPAIHFPAEVLFEENTPILTTENYGVSFDELLLENVSFEIGAHDKVALIGANGTGKTTLFRDIVSRIHPSIKLDASIQVAYLSQHLNETLDESLTVFELFHSDTMLKQEDVADYLEPYGLERTIVSQKIGQLSGGEKNMLQLAKLGTISSQLLLLDEPTSHLDTYAQVALEKALAAYKGAILMISHDFYAITHCMDYALLIDEKTIRKVSMRKLRKTIYAKHFDKDYLAHEQKKKELELKIELALKENNIPLAKSTCLELEEVMKLFK